MTTAVRGVFRTVGKQSAWVGSHLPRSGVVREKLPNGRYIRFWSRGDDWVSNQVFWLNWRGFEPEVSSLFYELSKTAKVVFDVGAHVGFYTLIAASHRDTQVFSFEPMPAVFKRLNRNVAGNGFRNVKCMPCAVGETVGQAEFYFLHEGIPSSSGLSQEFMQNMGDLQHMSVPVITLDSFVEEHKIARVDLMKLDTETTEPQVLKGMIETLKRDHTTLICEVLAGYNVEAELESLLKPLGYLFYLLTDEGAILKDTIQSDERWHNYMFTVNPEDALKVE